LAASGLLRADAQIAQERTGSLTRGQLVSNKRNVLRAGERQEQADGELTVEREL
jgi:hypothetical protein